MGLPTYSKDLILVHPPLRTVRLGKNDAQFMDRQPKQGAQREQALFQTEAFLGLGLSLRRRSQDMGRSQEIIPSPERESQERRLPNHTVYHSYPGPGSTRRTDNWLFGELSNALVEIIYQFCPKQAKQASRSYYHQPGKKNNFQVGLYARAAVSR